MTLAVCRGATKLGEDAMHDEKNAEKDFTDAVLASDLPHPCISRTSADILLSFCREKYDIIRGGFTREGAAPRPI